MSFPSDRRAQLYARPVKGRAWTPKTVAHILTSEAALGYLMHGGRPVTGPDGKPVRIGPPLWDRPTRDALIAKTAPKRPAADRQLEIAAGQRLNPERKRRKATSHP